MPITNLDNLIRFSNHCGAEIPTWLLQQLQAYGNDKQAVIDFSIDVVSKLCEKLLIAGAPSLHFYTLNKLIATEDICRNIFS